MLLTQLLIPGSLAFAEIPAAPAHLEATPLDGNSVQLDWNAVAFAKQYRVYRSSDGENFIVRATVDTINYKDSGLAPNTSYYYYVKAINADGESAPSNTVSATTLAIDNVPPTVPGNVTATAQDQRSIRVSWAASTDNSGSCSYTLYFREASTGSFTPIDVNNTTYLHSNLIPGKTYYYYIKAVDEAGNSSAQSVMVSAATLADTVKPSQPGNLAATVGGMNTINLSWSPSTDAVGVKEYNIYRRSGTTAFVKIAASVNTSYTDSNLVPGNTYIYEVSAVDLGGNESERSLPISRTTAVDTEPPAKPGDLTATSGEATRISLQWSAPSDNDRVSSYNIYRSTNGSNFTKRSSVTARSFTDSSLTPNVKYYYRVTAVDRSGNESLPAQVEAVAALDSQKPTPPTIVMARANASKTRVYLEWHGANDNDYVEDYIVYRTREKGKEEKVTTTSDNEYTDRDVDANLTYSYYVVARDNSGNLSTSSPTVSVTLNGDYEPPTKPTNLKIALNGDTGVKLSWTASTDITKVQGYYVYRAHDDDDFDLVGMTTSTSFDDKDLHKEDTYRYYVKAYDSAGNLSEASGTESIYTSEKDQRALEYVSNTGGGTLELGDDSIRLEIPAYAVESSVVVNLKVKSLGDYSAEGFQKVGKVAEFTTDKAKELLLQKEATLTFTWQDEDLGGTSTGRLRIFKWESAPKRWRALVTSIDSSDNEATAKITELGVYALLADVEGPEKPVVTVKETELDRRVYLLKGEAEPFTNVEVYINGNQQCSLSVDEKGQFAGDILFRNGSNTLQVRARDAVGNGSPYTEVFTIKAFSKAYLRDISGHWAEVNIQKMLESEVINGYADQTFRPDKTISRVEFAAFVISAMGGQSSTRRSGTATGSRSSDDGLPFTDAHRIPEWAQGYVASALRDGIISGYSDGSFRPNNLITRQEMAVMLVKALKLQSEAEKRANSYLGYYDQGTVAEWARGYVAVAADKGIISGYSDNSFRPFRNASRAEAVSMLAKFANLKTTRR